MNTLKRYTQRWHAILSISLLMGLAHASSIPRLANAQTMEGTIAYTRDNDVTGDEIWLIEPDGSNNHRIWGFLQVPSKRYIPDSPLE